MQRRSRIASASDSPHPSTSLDLLKSLAPRPHRLHKKRQMQHLAEAQRVFDAEIEGLDLVKSRLANEFEQAIDLILACQGKVVVAGIGKSGIIGHKASRAPATCL